jgi:hypothetical protein
VTLGHGGRRITRALAVVVLALLLVVAGAVPAEAGGGRGSAPTGRSGGGADAGGGHSSEATASRARGGPAPGAKDPKGGRPEPSHQPAARRAPAKPPASRPDAKPAPPAQERQAGSRAPRSKVDAPAPEPVPQPETVERVANVTPRQARWSTADAATPTTRPREQASLARAGASTIDSPVAALTEPAVRPLVAPLDATIAERVPRPLWSSLPGPAGHPSFPGLLTAVLVGFVALACRGDRRDPKLAAAAIDDRDERTFFG